MGGVGERRAGFRVVGALRLGVVLVVVVDHGREGGDDGGWRHGLAGLECVELLGEIVVLLGEVLDVCDGGAQHVDAVALGLAIVLFLGQQRRELVYELFLFVAQAPQKRELMP